MIVAVIDDLMFASRVRNAAARAAGVEVLARSAFTARFGEILQDGR